MSAAQKKQLVDNFVGAMKKVLAVVSGIPGKVPAQSVKAYRSLWGTKSGTEKGRIMKRMIPYAAVLTLALLTAGVALAQKASPAKPSVPKGWKFSFPEGNPETGKQLFVKMECYACHTIKLPKETLAAQPGKVGPELTGYAVLPKEYLASAIIQSHAVVAAPGYAVKEGKAVMGNYNHFLTVQELIDLVAFLSKGATTPAK